MKTKKKIKELKRRLPGFIYYLDKQAQGKPFFLCFLPYNDFPIKNRKKMEILFCRKKVC